MDEHVCVYVRGKWPFPWDSGLLYLSSFHPLAIWSFSMSWFDWIGAHLLSFLSIFFHILSHSPCLHHSLFIYIHILCLIFSSSLLLHLLLQFDFFFHSFITNIFLLFLSSPLIYSHWTSFDPWLMRFSTHIAFCTRGYGFDHWVFEPSFLSFLHPITLVYVTSHVLRPPWGHVIMHYVW